jgi:hypothetical protein
MNLSNTKFVSLRLSLRLINLFFLSALGMSGLLFPSQTLAQRILQGRVLNGTTGQAAGGQRVELLALGQGMTANADTVTAADGSFQFSLQEDSSSPHWLLRAIYHGVNYNLSVTTSQDLSQPVTLTIYETTDSLKGIEVSLPLMLAQASGNVLYVQQQYLLTNNTQPKRTLANSAGTFLFDTPKRELLDELTVSVVGLAGIPLPQEPTPRQEGLSINYPMKPGVNEVRISYKVKFSSNERDFKHKLFYGADTTRLLVLPPTLKLSGPGLQPAGNDSRTQAAVYQLSSLAKGSFLQLKLVGDAPTISDEGEHGPNDGHDHDEPQVQVVRLPNRVFEQRILIIGGFAALFALAILFAVRQRAAATSGRRKRPK